MNFKFVGRMLVVGGALAAALASHDVRAAVTCPAVNTWWYSYPDPNYDWIQRSCSDGGNYINNMWFGAFNYGTGQRGNAEGATCTGSGCNPKTTYGGTWWTQVAVKCANNGTYFSGWVQGPSGAEANCPGTYQASEGYYELQVQ
jgi:hypothetical protein